MLSMTLQAIRDNLNKVKTKVDGVKMKVMDIQNPTKQKVEGFSICVSVSIVHETWSILFTTSMIISMSLDISSILFPITIVDGSPINISHS